jgi:hypothetical protein
MGKLLLVYCFLAFVPSFPATKGPVAIIAQDVMWLKFDEYSQISFNKEKLRLKEFATQLQGQRTATAYIVVYAGRHSCKDEAQARAERVKQYLIRFGHINARRIRTIDAGHQEEWAIALYTAASSDPPLTAEFIKKTESHLPAEQVHIVPCVGKFLGPH